MAGAPWRAARKFPLADRDRVLNTLASSGAEVILGGHIHQAMVTSSTEFTAPAAGSRVVLVTAPGLGRPRPSRLGEAQGLQIVGWSADELNVDTYTFVESTGRSGRFICTGRRLFKRGDMHSCLYPMTVEDSSTSRKAGRDA
jgi:hypothetical protein